MRFLLMMLLLLTSAAAPAARLCYPSPLNPPEHVERLPVPLGNGDTHWISWSCPPAAGIYIDTFKLPDVQAMISMALAGVLNTSEADALRATLPHATDAEFDALVRRVLVNYYGAHPLTLAAVGYKRRISIDPATKIGSYIYVPFATIPVGVQCTKVGSAGDFMPVPVPRAQVHLNSFFDAYPDIVYAPCG